MSQARGVKQEERPGLSEPAWIRWTLTAVVALFLGTFLLLPLAVVFHSALAHGISAYVAALTEPHALSAMKLTLLAAGISLVLNTVFGVAAAWLVTRFRFPGKTLLISLIDLPFAVSPVIAGLIFVLIFGAKGWAHNQPLHMLWPIVRFLIFGLAALSLLGTVWRWRHSRKSPHPGRIFFPIAIIAAAIIGDAFLSPWLAAGNDVEFLFSWPAIVVTTMFITFPFVARELIPVMQSVGQEEEQAALSLGASGWTTFRRITLPNVKWGLLYGIILCNARAMGEFGAVSVVSGHIMGRTNTLPLHIQLMFESNMTAAFAVASLLAALALVTLVVKTILESRMAKSGDQI